jgi:hypothetical protein
VVESVAVRVGEQVGARAVLITLAEAPAAA